MAILVVYMLINIVLSVVVERKSRKTVNVLHAILFFFTFAILCLCTNEGILQQSVCNLLGKDVYAHAMTAMFAGGVSAIIPLTVVEFVLWAQALIVAMMTVDSIVNYLGGKKRKAYERLCDNSSTPPRWKIEPLDKQNLYSILQVLLC